MRVPRIGLGWADSSAPPVLRHLVLGGHATYRVLHQAGSIVQVEVLDAPGLAPGTRLYLTAEAAAAMTRAPVRAARRVTRPAGLATRAAAGSTS